MTDVKERILARRARLVLVALAACTGHTTDEHVVVVGSAHPMPVPTDPPPPLPPPPLDSDDDGVPDDQDYCPKQKGMAPKGCPCLSIITPYQIQILVVIRFPSNVSNVLPIEYKKLDEIAALLKAHPEFRVRVRGHIDSTETANVAMLRAAWVKKELVLRKIDASRLEVQSAGGTMPVAPNTTAEGREQNRRVDFLILEEDGGVP